MEDDVFNPSRDARGLFRDPEAAKTFVDDFSCEMSVQWLNAIGKNHEYIHALYGVEPLDLKEFLHWCSIASLLASLFGIDSYQLSKLAWTYKSVSGTTDGSLPPGADESLKRARYEFECLEVAVENMLDDIGGPILDQRDLDEVIIDIGSNPAFTTNEQCVAELHERVDGLNKCGSPRAFSMEYRRACQRHDPPIEPLSRKSGRPPADKSGD